MKKVFFLMMGVIALTSCRTDMSSWNSNVLEANDNVVTKEYKLAPFEKVDMRCVGNLELIQSDTKDGVVELEAPDNYIELYKFESDGKKLDINISKKNTSIVATHVRIKVYTTDLIYLRNSGASSIKMNDLDSDQIEIVNSGVGSISISGVTDNANLVNSGVGTINAQDLKALNVKASVSGVGSITCYASEKIEGHVSGIGSLKYTGSPKQKVNRRTGIGSITEL